jgi:Mg-chelatase subunit ChlD
MGQITPSGKRRDLATPLHAKPWLKKIETSSGKPIDLNILEQQAHYKPSEPSNKRKVTYVLVDCSGSMSDEKLQFAKDGAIAFAVDAVAKSYQIGVIRFDTIAEELLSPVDNIEKIKQAIALIVGGGSTNLASAIAIATGSLTDKATLRCICIVTDGAPDCVQDAIDEADKAKAAGIEIITRGTDDADIGFLERISTKKEFAAKVERKMLASSIREMSRLLPGN